MTIHEFHSQVLLKNGCLLSGVLSRNSRQPPPLRVRSLLLKHVPTSRFCRSLAQIFRTSTHSQSVFKPSLLEGTAYCTLRVLGGVDGGLYSKRSFRGSFGKLYEYPLLLVRLTNKFSREILTVELSARHSLASS